MRTETGHPPLSLKSQAKSAPWVVSRCVAFLTLLASTVLFPAKGDPQTLHASQSDVEAAYLYDFAKFVHWPGEAHLTVMNICILGHDPFGSSLDRIVRGERIDNHTLTVTRLNEMSGSYSCAMVFIASSEEPRLTEEMLVLAGSPVMTVSDMPGFMERGGMIQFVLKDDRVRFKVNLNATNKCGLKVSSQLLKVAEAVEGKQQAAIQKPRSAIKKPQAAIEKPRAVIEKPPALETR